MSTLRTTILAPTEAKPPLHWSGPWVRGRLREAYDVDRRLPKGGRNGGSNAWPPILHDFADMVHWLDARARVWADWQRAKGAYSFEITRMEEAFGWYAILADHPGERRCLELWARSTPKLSRELKRRGWSRTTFYRRVLNGSDRIARTLNTQGVKVR